jgi:alkanesulfonate monooxygenase SsuD/methylene tetrahydromethanopterin reductase-like flavin-dependent oxidoreductase (luciferase family)
MQLCLSIEIQEGLSYRQTLDMTQAAEALGFSSSLLAEHYYPSGPLDSYPEGPGARISADAWIYLAALARETNTIRLGTLVSPVTFRHPAVLAKMAATLDHVSNGRAELGIGAGWLEAEHQAYGFAYPSGPERVDLVEEQLQVINGLFSNNPFSHAGKAYQLQEAHFTPKPLQQPRPTIIVGGRTTSRRLLRLAATYADEFVIGQPTPDEVRDVRQRLNAACAKQGRAPDAVRLSAFVPMAIGISAEEVNRHLDTYRQDNPQYVRMMDNLATWLMGTPDEVARQLSALAEAGVSRVMVSVNCDLHREMLPLLARALPD